MYMALLNLFESVGLFTAVHWHDSGQFGSHKVEIQKKRFMFMTGRYECGKNALETKPMQFIYKIASNYLELLY